MAALQAGRQAAVDDRLTSCIVPCGRLGWSGLRFGAASLAVQTPKLPAGITRMTLRGVHYRGVCVTARYNATHFEARLCAGGATERAPAPAPATAALVLVDAGGVAHTLSGSAFTAVPIGDLAFRVAS